MIHQFLGLEATEDALRFRLPVADAICVGPPGNVFLYGGAGLAAAIVAAEHATGRALIWSSAQFLSYARLGIELDLAVEIIHAGLNVSQARVTATASGATILTVNAALGDRSGQPSGQWAVAPDMPPPEECTPWALWPKQGASMNARLEVRMVPGKFGAIPRDGIPSADGRLVMWVRTTEDIPVDAALLAVFADYFPAAVAAAFGRLGGGNSLDNTLRVRRVVPTRWVLCDVQIDATDRGFAHGDIRLYAEEGTLMAIGSQSTVVRFIDE